MEQPIEIVFFFGKRTKWSHNCSGSIGSNGSFLMLTFLLGKQCNGIVLSDFFFDASLTAAAIDTLTKDVNGKSKEEGERTLILKLFICLRHKG